MDIPICITVLNRYGYRFVIVYSFKNRYEYRSVTFSMDTSILVLTHLNKRKICEFRKDVDELDILS